MSESLLELLEHVDHVKLYIEDGLYTLDAQLPNGIALSYDNLSLEDVIADVLDAVGKMV